MFRIEWIGNLEGCPRRYVILQYKFFIFYDKALRDLSLLSLNISFKFFWIQGHTLIKLKDIS